MSLLYPYKTCMYKNGQINAIIERNIDRRIFLMKSIKYIVHRILDDFEGQDLDTITLTWHLRSHSTLIVSFSEMFERKWRGFMKKKKLSDNNNVIMFISYIWYKLFSMKKFTVLHVYKSWFYPTWTYILIQNFTFHLPRSWDHVNLQVKISKYVML